MKRIVWAALAALVLLPSFVFGQGRYDNARYGFSITAPEKWDRIPTKPEERWIVARFKSNRAYPCEDGWNEHTPMLMVMLFPKEQEKKTGSLGASEKKDEGDEEEGSVTISFVNPYKNYMDYLKGNFQAGGFYVGKEEEATQGGTPVTRMEIKVEKLAAYGQQRIVTWVFHAPIGDFAVQCDVLEDKFDKIGNLIYAALGSFRVTKPDPKASEDDDLSVIKLPFRPEGISNEAWTKQKMDYTEKVLKKAKSDLPPGWGAFDTKHFLVIYHCPANKAQKYANQAEACREWMNKAFNDIGDEYVAKCILRICENRDEEMTYRSGSFGSWSFENREITTNVSGGDKKSEFFYINTSVMHKFFSDKNSDLWIGLPYWLERGLDYYVGAAEASGRNLLFKPGLTEKEDLREGKRNGDLKSVKEMMLTTGKEARDLPWSYEAQCGSVVRFLLSGPGRGGATKDLVKNYIKNLIAILEKKEKEEEAKRKAEREAATRRGDDEPMTEEEEEEEYRKRRQQRSNDDWEKQKKQILELSMAETFKKWTDKHWEAFDAAWSAYSK